MSSPLLRINQLKIRQFMRIEVLDVDADGKHIVFSGPNASGKTSAIMCLWEMLKGHSSKDVPEPVHQGAEKAEGFLDLGAFTLEQEWEGDRVAKLHLKTKAGEKIGSPREFISRLVGEFSLNPIEWLQKKPADQIASILEAVNVAPPVADVKRITGKQILARDGERADEYLDRVAGDNSGIFFQVRYDANRLVEQKTKAVDEARETLERIGGPVTAEEQAADPTIINRQLQQLHKDKDKYQAQQQVVDDLTVQFQQKKRDKAAAEQRIKEAQARIEQLQQQIATEQEKILGDQSAIGKADTAMLQITEKGKAARQKLAELTNPDSEINKLNRQMTDATTKIEALAKRRHQAEVIETLTQESIAAIAAAKECDKTLQELRGLRAKLLEDIPLGIPNLRVTEKGLMLGGHCFKQASQAESIRVACAVAMKQKPDLRIMWIDGGERLDNNSRKLLFDIAKKNGWQVVMTVVVSDQEGLQVEIV